MKVLKQNVERDGKKYVDLYGAWTYENKTYCVRIRPVFGKDNDKLMSIATPVPQGEQVEKYI